MMSDIRERINELQNRYDDCKKYGQPLPDCTGEVYNAEYNNNKIDELHQQFKLKRSSGVSMQNTYVDKTIILNELLNVVSTANNTSNVNFKKKIENAIQKIETQKGQNESNKTELLSLKKFLENQELIPDNMKKIDEPVIVIFGQYNKLGNLSTIYNNTLIGKKNLSNLLTYVKRLIANDLHTLATIYIDNGCKEMSEKDFYTYFIITQKNIKSLYPVYMSLKKIKMVVDIVGIKYERNLEEFKKYLLKTLSRLDTSDDDNSDDNDDWSDDDWSDDDVGQDGGAYDIYRGKYLKYKAKYTNLKQNHCLNNY